MIVLGIWIAVSLVSGLVLGRAIERGARYRERKELELPPFKRRP